MSDTPPNEDTRLVRILAPGALLRQVDGVVQNGRGGYQTRQEFFLDAIENQLLEVTYSGAENGQRRLLQGQPSDGSSEGSTDESQRASEAHEAPEAAPATPVALSREPIQAFADFSDTELHAPGRGSTLTEGLAAVEDEPLFGLHNRDYPSLWATQQLLQQTQDGPVPLKDFVETAVGEAWRFAASLEELDRQASTKLTALFPKNRAKPQSAEESFKAFAIGALAKKPLSGGKLKASGPLYTWGLAQVQRSGDTLEIAPTQAAYELLEQLDGISMRLPHEEEFGERFLDFVAEHALADAAGFNQLLELVPEGLTRVELADSFKEWKPDWSDTEANTHAAAYVARAREWGLLVPKLIESRYALTEFGEHRRAAVAA